jgi:protein-L-isoaspartate(D-aspartate) O-methyltransferase
MALVGPSKNPRVRSAVGMVDQYLRSRGIRDERVLSAMSKVERHLFVPDAFRERAYSDHALPIGFDQTITQPYFVAFMTAELALTGKEKVLEVGTGSGYQTAVLAEIARSVFSIDRVHAFVTEARKRLENLGYHNISIRAGNGALGWSEFAPYDRILVTAAMAEVPDALLGQLTEGGTLIAPVVTGAKRQEVVRFDNVRSGWERRSLGPCMFVPLVDSSLSR